MSAIRSVTDYVSALKGEEFKELNADKAWRIGRIAVAEILGTAILVGLGCGSLVVFPGTTVTHLNVVLSFAFAVTLSITAFGHISGAFLNPSFGLTAMLIGKLSFPMFLVYTVSQCFGATIGLVAVKMVSPIECVTMENGFCVTLPDPLIGTNKALLAEAFMTFCVCMVFCSATDDRNQNKGDSIAIKFGLSIAAIALSGGKYTGCSMNPARSFAPAFLSSNWDQHWVYWVGPLTGAALAGLLYQIIFAENIPPAHNRKEPSDQQDQTRLETLQATA